MADDPGTVYLLHFAQPRRRGRHYLGSSGLPGRLAHHEAGKGARLMAVIKAACIGFELARTWPGGRTRERQIKNRHEAPRLCPVCTDPGAQGTRAPLQEEQMINSFRRRTAGQEAADPPEAGSQLAGRRPEYVVTTWQSAQLRDRAQRAGMSLAEALNAGGRPGAELTEPAKRAREGDYEAGQ